MPWYVKILVILVLSLTLNQGYALGGHVKGPKGMPEIKFFTQEYPRHTECGQLTKKTHVQRTEKEEITWTIFFSGDSENPLLTIYEKLKYGYMVEGFIIADFWLDKIKTDTLIITRETVILTGLSRKNILLLAMR